MRNVETKNRVTSKSGPWNEGQGFTKTGADVGSGAGGPAVKKQQPPRSTGGAALNKATSGLRSLKEVHHNGGTHSIRQGSTNAPR